MKNIVINFIAAPCVGKSTMASLLFAEMKMSHHSVEYVQEIAKKLIYEEKYEELNNQYNISKAQYDIIKAVSKKVKYTITDSGLFVNLFYNREYKDNICNTEKVEKIFREKLDEFHNINIFLSRNNDFPYEQEGRVHDEKQSKEIEQRMEDMMIEYKLPYKKFVSYKGNLMNIIEYIYDQCE